MIEPASQGARLVLLHFPTLQSRSRLTDETLPEHDFAGYWCGWPSVLRSSLNWGLHGKWRSADYFLFLPCGGRLFMINKALSCHLSFACRVGGRSARQYTMWLHDRRRKLVSESQSCRPCGAKQRPLYPKVPITETKHLWLSRMT